jgi:hypothetical protein
MTKTTSELTRRDYEHRCAGAVQALALLGGEIRHDSVWGDLTESALRGRELPGTDPSNDREILERAALEAGALCSSYLGCSLEGMWTVDSGLDLSRLDELAERLQEVSREITLEVGRLLLETPAEEPEPHLNVVNA